MNVFALLRLDPNEIELNFVELIAEVEKIQQLLKDKNTEGLIKLDQSAVLPANECIRDAIKKLGVFHSSKPLKFLKSGELGVGSLKILYFYHNRLDNYDFLTTNYYPL